MNVYAGKIHSELIKRIVNKELRPGELIPTEEELARQYATNRMNAHIAVKQLEKEGVVLRKKKRGTVIRDDLQEELILRLRNEKADTVYIFLSSLEKKGSSYIHWDESTVTEFERILRERGYKCIFHEIPASKSELKKTMKHILNVGVAGLVFFPLNEDVEVLKKNYAALYNYPGRIFIVNRGTHPPFAFPCHTLQVSPYQEGFIAAEYVMKKKYDSVVFLCRKSSRKSYWLQQRINGFTETIEYGNYSFKYEIMEYKEEFPRQKVLEKAESNITDSLIFITQTDQLAAELIDFVRSNGMDVPKNFHVLSFDNDPRMRKYNLTTIAPKIYHIPVLLSEMISIVANGKFTGARRVSVTLESELIERGTTKRQEKI